MLCEGPIGHNKCSNHKKDVACNSLCRNIESQPLINFCSVISTGHNIEQKPPRDLIPSTSISATKILQQYMAIKVCDLTNYSKSKANLHLEVTNWGISWVVHIVGNIRTKGPIISTVPKHIRNWRRCMTEAVHKKCFHNSFEVVETPVV